MGFMKDKEKQITINREAGAMVDLLNNEIEELQKASAIDEMTKDIEKTILGLGVHLCHKSAEKLLNLGYRKLPEDSVVLSREEYEKLRSLYDCEQGSYMTSSIGDLPLTVEGLRKAVDEITRLNRVEAELQELNIKYYNEAKDSRRELKQASKETAEKILNTIYDKLNTFEAVYEIDYESYVNDVLWEITKQFGLEIKE